MTNSASAPRSAVRAIVTGHTRGLGAALAKALLQRDIDVLGLGRGTHSELASQYATRFAQAVVDLADPAALESWLAGETLKAFAINITRVSPTREATRMEMRFPTETPRIKTNR